MLRVCRAHHCHSGMRFQIPFGKSSPVEKLLQCKDVLWIYGKGFAVVIDIQIFAVDPRHTGDIFRAFHPSFDFQ